MTDREIISGYGTCPECGHAYMVDDAHHPDGHGPCDECIANAASIEQGDEMPDDGWPDTFMVARVEQPA